MQIETVQPKGQIEISIQYKNGTTNNLLVKNTVLQLGREALAASLAHDFGTSYEYYIDTMLFGTGGVDGDAPKYIDATRIALYSQELEKPISALISPLRPHEAVFSSVLTFDDPAIAISEMGLRMANINFCTV